MVEAEFACAGKEQRQQHDEVRYAPLDTVVGNDEAGIIYAEVPGTGIGSSAVFTQHKKAVAINRHVQAVVGKVIREDEPVALDKDPYGDYVLDFRGNQWELEGGETISDLISDGMDPGQETWPVVWYLPTLDEAVPVRSSSFAEIKSKF